MDGTNLKEKTIGSQYNTEFKIASALLASFDIMQVCNIQLVIYYHGIGYSIFGNDIIGSKVEQ